MNSLRRILFASVALVASLPAFGQITYCMQTKPTSVPGCFAMLTAPDPTLVTGSWDVSNIPMGPGQTGANGIFIYTHGVSIGQSSVSVPVPFGTLCLSSFKRSTPPCPFLSFFAASNTCVASVSLPIDCNAGGLGITVGDDVNVQFWYRDMPAGAAANFSNAIFYTVQ